MGLYSQDWIIPQPLSLVNKSVAPCFSLAHAGIIKGLLNKWAWPTFFLGENG